MAELILKGKRAKLWAGEFGDEYTDRNSKMPDRREFWKDVLSRVSLPIGPSVLEIGCNIGTNLKAICDVAYDPYCWGVDVNEKAVMRAAMDPRLNIWRTESFDIPIESGSFDLVFTSGLLIHLDDEALEKTFDEMNRLSNNLIIMIEYFSEKTEMVPYRGVEDALWKRPYGKMFLAHHPKWRQFEVLDIGKDDGFDDCRVWIFQRRLQ